MRLLLEKLAENRPESIHIDEKRIVPEDTVKFDELGVLANRRQVFRQFALLAQRKQDVSYNTDDERPLQNQQSVSRKQPSGSYARFALLFAVTRLQLNNS